MASEAPVERTGTATFWRGVVRRKWKTRAPSRCKAKSASCTFTARLWDSDSTAAVSPSDTPQSRNVSANASIHLPSTCSTSIRGPLVRLAQSRYWTPGSTHSIS